MAAFTLSAGTFAHDFVETDFVELPELDPAHTTGSSLRAIIGAPNFPDVGGRWGSMHVWTSTTGGGAVSGLCRGDTPFDVIFCDRFESTL